MIGTNKDRFYQIDNLENSLDIVYKKLGDIQEALKFLEQKLKLGEGNDFNIANSLHNVDIAYEKLGDVKKGLKYWEQEFKMTQELESSPLEDIVIQNEKEISEKGINERDEKLKELDQIKYYQDHKDLILKCEKLDELPDEMFPKAIERLKERLNNINEACQLDSIIVKKDREFCGLKEQEMDQDNIKQFIFNYQKNHFNKGKFILKGDIHALLLNNFIILEKPELVKKVLAYPHYLNLFTVTNTISSNNLSSMFNNYNVEIIKIAKEYVKQDFKGPKTLIDELDQGVILNSYFLNESDFEDYNVIVEALVQNSEFLEYFGEY